ncbi:MAG: hypothetical protein KF688_08805 [Pirellulales bacterium]|nr:hypothetical protein [Pirellulales bacterium]
MTTSATVRSAATSSGLRAVRFGLVLACLSAVSGCGGSHETVLGDYLRELEFEAPLESVALVPLGQFRVPIAIRVGESALGDPPVWMRVQFELFAETSPENESALRDALDRYDGPFRDSVIRICRMTTHEELADPRLSALKSRLMDMARPLLGENRVRGLIVDKYKEDVL